MRNIEQIEAGLHSNQGKMISVGMPLFGKVYWCITGILTYHEEKLSNEDVEHSYFVVTMINGMMGIRFAPSDVINITEINGIKTITLFPCDSLNKLDI